MIILGIETSCDETCISIYNNKKGIILNEIHSQQNIHSKYGGVVPNIASKNHTNKIILLIKKIIKKYSINLNKINLISFTAGPGLSSSLIIGTTVAISLSYIYKIPYIPINHIEGHIMSIMISKKKPKFPFISLIISGSTTTLVIVYYFNKYKIIGKSLDDAAGEIFDKIGNLIGLKYPAGNKIYKYSKFGKKKFNFPQPLKKKNNFNFSFSGLKTYITNFIKNKKKINLQFKYNIAYSLQETIIDLIIFKLLNASKKYKINNISIVGGVSSNKKLRKKLLYISKKYKKKIFYPNKNLCTDNAAMIAYTGYIKYITKKNKIKNKFIIKVKPNWNINENF